MIRIFVADDHAIVRRGLRELVAQTADLTVVGEADDGHAVLSAYAPGLWDVLVLDLSLPRLSGSEVIRRLRERDRKLPILVLSMYSEAQYGRRLIDEGANAYMSKDHPAEEILVAIRTVATRGVRQSAEQPAIEKRAHHDLTAREFQILILMCQSRTQIEIAAELNISASTVGTHVAKIRTKLGARTNGDILTYAVRAGLAE